MKEHFTTEQLEALSDETWGPGNWVRCPQCLDSLGDPSYHHVNFHAQSALVRSGTWAQMRHLLAGAPPWRRK